jgi:CDP-paratose 2-epimerase
LQKQHGVSEYGVAEDFSTSGPKSLYGVTKFAAEQLIQEYADAFGLRAVINRCGVIAGPGQFGRSDQGIVPFWIKAHLQEQPLSYIGFGGQGKQVRDILHICDLERLMVEQIRAPEPFLGEIFNVGGGMENAVSLLELTELCRRHTGKQIEISAVPENRYADVPLYVTDNGRISARCGWAPEFGLESIVSDTCQWLKQELV